MIFLPLKNYHILPPADIKAYSRAIFEQIN